ncbi:MAG: HAMP domain-containing protein, partial [Candidatus Brocadiae bacterium]|nr:HAMP domain-containing protein [Candidatus Brocadiia bacterium]
VLAVFRAPAALALAAWLPLIAPRRAVLPLVAVGGILAAAAVTGFTLLREADRGARTSLADRVERAAEWQDALYAGLAEELASSLLRLPADRPPAERDLLEIWASSAAAREGLGVGVGWSDGTSWWTFAVGMPEWDPKALAAAPSASPEPVALRGGLLLDHTVIAERPGRRGKTIATVRARADETPVSILRAGPAPAGTEALWRAGRWLPPGLLADPPKLEAGAEEWRVLEIGGERHEVAFRRQEAAEERVWAFSRKLTGPGESAVRLLRVLVILVGCGAGFAVMLALLAGIAGTIPSGWTGLLEVRLTIALVAVSAVPLIALGLFARTLAVHPLDTARSRLDLETAGIALQGLYAARSGQFSAVDDRSVMNMESLVGRDLCFYRNGQLQALGQPALRSLDLVPGMVPGAAWRAVALGDSMVFTETEGFRGLSGSAGWYAGNRTRKVTLAVPEAPGPPSPESGRAASLALGGCTLIALLLWPVSALVARRISGPVAALTRAAERIEEGDLAARVEVPAEGEVADLVAAFNRMTEGLARGRDALARAERERAWREMARQVAHEIKNPLTPLKLALQNLRAAWRAKDPAFGEQLEESVDLTVNQIDILARIATDFSQFAGRPRRTVLPLDLNVILREVLDLFRPTAAGITIVEDCEEGLLPVPADRAEMIRVFTNLVKNAVQAMPSGGMLTATTRNEGTEVEVRIRDTGAGIPEEVRPRMFEPYFSTKSEGTGLGLGIVRRVLDDMGGRIAFESEPGRGTVMILRMPAGGAPAERGGEA